MKLLSTCLGIVLSTAMPVGASCLRPEDVDTFTECIYTSIS